MFTGIVSEIGEVRAVIPGGDTRYRIGCSAAMADAPLGASIACDGVCLTVVATSAPLPASPRKQGEGFEEGRQGTQFEASRPSPLVGASPQDHREGQQAGAGANENNYFEAEASAETLSRTTLGSWREGTSINLERALRMGDELGGHLVSGHVDGLATLREQRPEGDSLRLVFEAPAELMRFIAPKGSVTLSGVSLTVNEVDGASFGVNIIAHTQSETTLGALRPGEQVNLEIDMLARYVARMLEAK